MTLAGLYDDPMKAGARAQTGLEITSPANPRVKHLVALRHRRARDRAGVTLVEGFEELGLALAAGARPVSLYVCSALDRKSTRLYSSHPSISYFVCCL